MFAVSKNSKTTRNRNLFPGQRHCDPGHSV